MRDVDVVRFDGLDVKRGIDSDLLGIKKRAKKCRIGIFAII